VDHLLSEADRAAALARVLVLHDATESGKQVEKARRRIHTARLTLRAYVDDPDPD